MNYKAVLFNKAEALGKHKSFLSYVQNTFWLMFERVFALAVAFVIGIFVARYLGPSNLGLLDFGRSIAVFFITFSSLSIEHFLVKNLIEDRKSEAAILGTFLSLRLAASMLSLSIIFLLYFLNIFEDHTIFFIVVLIASSSFFSSFDILRSYFQSNVKSQKIALGTTLQILVSSALKIYFIVEAYPILYFASVYVIETMVFVIGLIYAYQQEDKKILAWKYDHRIATETLKLCWPSILSGLIIIIYMRVDQVMIKWLLSAESVGYYSAAVRLSELWFFIGTVMCNSLFPAIIKARTDNPALYKKRMQSLLSLMVMIALAIILPISLFSSSIVSSLYGVEFAPAGSVLAIHAWSLLFVFLGQVGSRWLINENLQRLSLSHTVSGMVINIGLNIIFIPKYGIEGAAITTLFSQMVASYLGNLFSRKSRSLFFAQTRALSLFHIASLLVPKKQ